MMAETCGLWLENADELEGKIGHTTTTTRLQGTVTLSIQSQSLWEELELANV